MTGSGMGCPDWPKCFGQWVPPTDISQLPENYKDVFAVAGKEIADFDAFKTWVEYVNRLIGVVIGLLAVATAAISLRIRKLFPQSTWASIVGLLLVIVQGGLGAYVVRTNLAEGKITLHMVMALLILGVFIYAWLNTYRQSWQGKLTVSPSLVWLGLGVLCLVLVQIILGTQVREAIDVIAKQGNPRDTWITALKGGAYDIHRYFYYLVVLGLGYWSFLLWEVAKQWPLLKTMVGLMGGIVLAEIGLGIGMHHFAVPAWMQPGHLVLASGLFGCVFATCVALWLGRIPSGDKETGLKEGRTEARKENIYG